MNLFQCADRGFGGSSCHTPNGVRWISTMFKRNFIFPLLTTLVISALFLFISCAHQEKSEDDADLQGPADGEEQIAGSIDDGGGDQPASDDKKAQADLQEPADDDAPAKKDDAKAAAGDDDKSLNDQLESASAEDAKDEQGLDKLANNAKDASHPAPSDAPPTTQPPPAADAQGDFTGPTQGAANDLTAPADQTAAASNALPPQTSLPPQVDSSPAPAAPESIVSSPSTEAPMPTFQTSVAKKRKPHAHLAHRGGHHNTIVPQIPGSAKEQDKTLLNRFYFARKGDTAESVSQLVYGTPDKANLLTQWNPGSWTPGTLLFYNSASAPEDHKMLALYQENSVTPEEYVVQRRDWLSKIAAKKLGDSGSWKEIAAVNGVDRPDSIEVGQKLVIYSGDLHGTATPPQPQQPVQPPPQMADASKHPSSPQATASPIIPPPGTLPPSLTSPSNENPAELPPPMEPAFGKKTRGNSGGTADLSKLVEQNLFAVAVGGVLLLLLILLVAVNRKKKGRHGDDFADDAFMAPTKSKRK
jgi:LysM domain